MAAAENFWAQGTPWEEEFRALLECLLQVVPWQEALARACAELLEGDWARDMLPRPHDGLSLWPSQRAGIAQALWVLENLGSVLVADATGSGKTKMGASLMAAVRGRLFETGRLRRDRDLTTLVCPPAVLATWQREALLAGVTVMPVSQGLLSQPDADDPRVEVEQVARAQVLAVDEAHNFLSPDSKRTQRVRQSLADHVLLFTATPINRGTEDLLALVGLLGADNFDDETLEILERLDRGARIDEALSARQRAALRTEIQRFTVRRTKTMLNELVAQDEDAYAHPDTGRVCRYPRHQPTTYATGEIQADSAAAEEIRRLADRLLGVIHLGKDLKVPAAFRDEFTEQEWLDFRLKSITGLARHHVLAAMRSSKAALIEHLAGTAEAVRQCGLTGYAKAQPTGDIIANVRELAANGYPDVKLTCQLPPWLKGKDAWRAACADEEKVYRDMLTVASKISHARERTKAELLARQAARDSLVLAFDHHPITLEAIKQEFPETSARVLIATGEQKAGRKAVGRLFARDSEERAVALCSDALNEGLNLQGAAALVHLDLPTTLRVAEQRVGRVDRMDSPHDEITVWWPDDGPAFATRAIDRLLDRRQASEALLGSNLPMPEFSGREEKPVSVEDHIRELDRGDATWDGIRDALEPVRGLVTGAQALVPDDVYAEHRHTRQRVMSRVAPVAAPAAWAFLALSGSQHGAPRWMVLEGEDLRATTGVEAVTDRLRAHLAEDPPNVGFDENCERWLGTFLDAAAEEETRLLPRRIQRALEQMKRVTRSWGDQALNSGDHAAAEQWWQVSRTARPRGDVEDRLDPYLVGEAWWDLVRPLFAEIPPRRRRRRRYTRLRDLNGVLGTRPLELRAVQDALRRVPVVQPVDRRVNAAIIGVPQ